MMIAGETHDLCPHDTARLAELLTALDRPGKVGIDMTRWEGDSLQVMLNDRFGFPMYLRTADDTVAFTSAGETRSTKWRLSPVPAAASIWNIPAMPRCRGPRRWR
jgi:hypothetical protein